MFFILISVLFVLLTRDGNMGLAYRADPQVREKNADELR